MFLFGLYLLCCSALMINSVEVDFTFQGKFAEGENRYKELIKKSYGGCWKEALSRLHLGCKDLTEEIQSRLALSFTNCFLEHSGSKTCPCSDGTSISECLRNSSDRVFSAYTEFFTHTHSICHYLQHKEWQHETEKTVIMLTESSDTVSKKLDESSKSQSKILDLQQVSLLEQRRLISNGRTLNVELQKSRNHAKNVFDEFKSTTNEQRLLIFEVFDRIKSLQNLVLGEFTSVYTFAYYIAGVFLIYILTSVPPTADARIWLLILISVNAIVERTLASYSLDEEMLKMFPLDSSGPMYSRIWMFRKIIICIGIATLLFFYYRFKDYNAMNNQLLREIQLQNADIQEFIKNMKLGQLSSPPPIIVSRIETISTSTPKNKVQVASNLNVSSPRVYQSGETAKSMDSSIEPKVVKKTPAKLKRQSNKQNTPKENDVLSSKENIDEQGSVTKRYNLRSRQSTPVTSPLSNKSSPIEPKDLVAAVKKRFGSKSPISSRI